VTTQQTSPGGSASQIRRCPYCAEIIQPTAIKCRFCGEFLDGSSNETSPSRQEAAGAQRPPNPGVAAVLSFFIPGLGQIYRGKVLGGLGYLIATLLLYALGFAGNAIYLLGGLGFHVASIVQAYRPDSDEPSSGSRVAGHDSGRLFPDRPRRSRQVRVCIHCGQEFVFSNDSRACPHCGKLQWR
jgi:TM2 domain-containing membrane protein YozV/RNA polymerase subunit RPABC4/transcription elongation factor Spt4